MIVVYIVLVMGFSTLLWSFVGLLRVVAEHHGPLTRALSGIYLAFPGGRARHQRRHPLRYQARGQRHPANAVGRHPSQPQHTGRHLVREAGIFPGQVAVLVAAHNEELVIGETIKTISTLVPLRNIHVISDMSSDATAAIARAAGVKVLELAPNRGKAGALAAGIEHFRLCKRFKVVMLLDADTRPAPDYLTTGLPMFNDPKVVAVAGCAKSIIRPHPRSWLGRFLVAYRERLYVVVQMMLKYGQAARSVNVVPIVPGFASMYRTTALAKIDVLAPGLVIEDFNMTFEIHAKKLGRIAFHPGRAVAYTQDPDTFRDYSKQVERWILGFWQTIRRHKMRWSRFWVVMVVYIFEVLASCVFFVLLLPVFVLSLLATVELQLQGNKSGDTLFLAGLMRPQDVLIGVLLPDFLLTVVAVIATRRPVYLLLAPMFPLMRIVDAVICLRALAKAYSSKSSGVWVSPARRVQKHDLQLVGAGPGGDS